MNGRRVPGAGPHRLDARVAIPLLAALLLGLFTSLVLGATATAATAGSRSISGKVTDIHGVGPPDVEVEVLTPDLESVGYGVTDDTGSYSVTDLPSETVYVTTGSFNTANTV